MDRGLAITFASIDSKYTLVTLEIITNIWYFIYKVIQIDIFRYTIKGVLFMRISIRNKITLTLMAIVLVVIVTIGIMTYNNSKNIVLTQAKQSNYDTLQNANDYFLRKFLSDMEYVVNYWSKNEDLRNWKNRPNQPKMVRSVPKHFEHIQQQLSGYTQSSPYIAWIYFGPEEDGSLFVTPLDLTMPDDYDCRERGWYREAVLKKDKVVWSDPYQDAGDIGGIVVTVSKAVENDGHIVGVVGMDIRLNRLADIFADIKFGAEGYLILIDGDGVIFSHPQEERLMTNICDAVEFCGWSYSGLETEILDYKGEKSIISSMDVPGTNWRLLGIMPIDMAAKLVPIRSVILKIAAVSLVLSFLICYFLSALITKPLSQMMVTIGRISEGDLNQRIDIEANDEFDILGTEFNKMINILQELLKERDLSFAKLTKLNEEIIKQSDRIKEYSKEKEAMNTELSRLLEEIKENYLSTVRALASAIEVNDVYTWGHCERVSDISKEIGKAMGVGEAELQTIEFAALLHDIGKIGITAEILNKKDKLTEEEYELIKKHPSAGYEILTGINFLEESRNLILQHHERIDGKGYPRGLAGENILKSARIMAVADAYDAMTSSRPYRKTPLTKKEAIKELIRGKGKQFDASIVDCFVSILETVEL